MAIQIVKHAKQVSRRHQEQKRVRIAILVRHLQQEQNRVLQIAMQVIKRRTKHVFRAQQARKQQPKQHRVRIAILVRHQQQ